MSKQAKPFSAPADIEMQTDTHRRSVVLLVDDQAMVGEGIRRMLADVADIEFHYCENPAQAIQTALTTRATVILQDLIMPDVDGMTLVRFYKSHPQTRNIPVIVLSSKEDPEIKREAFENGANDYLVKLPDPIELIARIRAHTNHFLTQLERNVAYSVMEEMHKQLEHANAELAERNRELQRISSIDGLTGVANRRCFDEELQREWSLTQRMDCTLDISLILIDIDYFKSFNDGYGHLAGDDCLKQVARTLGGCVTRACDLFARYGGEEFVAICSGTSAQGAMQIAGNMQKALAELALKHEYSKVEKVVTISMGIATLAPGKDNLPEQLIAAADEALYTAKESGRNRAILRDSDKP